MENGNTLHVTATILRYTSQQGGFEAFFNEFATKVTKKTVTKFINKTQKEVKIKKAP